MNKVISCLSILFLIVLVFPMSTYAQDATNSSLTKSVNREMEWYSANKDNGYYCGSSWAKDPIQRHLEAVLYALLDYASSMPTRGYMMEDKDGNVQSSFVSDGTMSFSLEIVDISFHRDCESVAIRIEDGEDYHIQLATEDTYSSSNGIENRTVMKITSTVSPENALLVTYQDLFTNTASSTEVSFHFVNTSHKDIKQQKEIEITDEFKTVIKERIEGYYNSKP